MGLGGHVPNRRFFMGRLTGPAVMRLRGQSFRILHSSDDRLRKKVLFFRQVQKFPDCQYTMHG
jgi:hypothetical protein